MNSKELEERLINFAVLIITIAENLKGRSGFILSSQIIRSGTSCALNYGEAQSAESTADFIHKCQVVLKELRETYVNLRIIKKGRICKLTDELEHALSENNELISIFVATVKKLKQEQPKR
jgi:four helix bundle protein